MGERFNHQEIIAGYLRAYREANRDRGPEITYAKGWFTIKNSFGMIGTKHRHRDLKEMTSRLQARAASRAAQRDMEAVR